MAIDKVGNVENLKYMMPSATAAVFEKSAVKEPEKEINWTKWGSIGTAAAAVIIGGIYYARSGKSSSTVEKKGKKLSEEVSELAVKSKQTLKNLSPFEFDMESGIFKFIGKGKDVEQDVEILNKIEPTFVSKNKLVLNKVADINDKCRLFYSEDGKSFKYIDNDFEFFKLEQKGLIDGYKSIIECHDNSYNNSLHIYKRKNYTQLIFDRSNLLNIDIDNETNKVLSVRYKSYDIPTDNAEELLKDFDINKYISDKNFRDEFNTKVSDFAYSVKLKRLSETPEYKNILEDAQELRSPDTFLSVKGITDNLYNIFGIDHAKAAFNNTSEINKSNILTFLNEHKVLLDIKTDTTDFLTDIYGNPTKRKGISIVPAHYNIIDETDEIIRSGGSPMIFGTPDGRYIRYNGDCIEMLYINPETITKVTPRLTDVSNNNGFFTLNEFEDKNILELQMNGIPKKLYIEYNPELKEANQNKSYLLDFKTNNRQEISKNQNVLNEILETFDFTRLSEKDYITHIKSLIESVI